MARFKWAQSRLEAVHDVEGAEVRAWPRGWRGLPSVTRRARSATSERRRRSRRRHRRCRAAGHVGLPADRLRVTMARRSSPLSTAPQGLRGAADVLVDVVRLRPRERGHEADPERPSCADSSPGELQLESGDDRGHYHRSPERALQDHRADHDRRPRRQSVRASTRERGRALPLRALEEQAVLRRDSPGDRIPGRGHSAARPSDRLLSLRGAARRNTADRRTRPWRRPSPSSPSSGRTA